MAQKIIAANWKMYGTQQRIKALLQEILLGLKVHSASCQVIIFAPSIFLPLVATCLQDSSIKYGAQTVSEYTEGAYTGEIAASMLQDFACGYVLVGHSERRQLFAESNVTVAKKFARAQEAKLIPMLCVGETLRQRETEQTLQVIREQLRAVIDVAGIIGFKQAVIAYEPVWAIGTGKTASPAQAQVVHKEIREFLAEYDADVAQQISLLYGGSVKPDNAADLFAMPDIDGALVGGASLEAKQFLNILKAI